MFRKLLAITAIFIGCAVAGWLGYNYFVGLQPEAERHNPLVGALFALVMLGWGSANLARKNGGQNRT